MRVLLRLSVVFVVVISFPVAPTVLRGQQPRPQAAGGSDQPVLVHNGFITGQQFRDLPELRRRSYAAGIVDGALLAPLMGAPKASVTWFESCATGMTDDQIAAIISKFVNDNPARWHEPVHTQFYAAMRQACPKAP